MTSVLQKDMRILSKVSDSVHNRCPSLLIIMTAREQLMEDIDGIVEEHSYYSNMSADKAEELIRVLCDAVCRNFPNPPSN